MRGSLVLYASLDGFRHWLDEQLFRRFGRAASNRSICIKAGLPENALYRVLTRGDRPSDVFCQRMGAYLTLDPSELERRAGLRPMLEVHADGRDGGLAALSASERAGLKRAMEAALVGLDAPS
jgi:hypothetical protein